MTDHLRTRTGRYVLVILRWVLVVSVVFATTMWSGVYITRDVLAKAYTATAIMRVQPVKPDPEKQEGWTFSSPQRQAVEEEFESIESPQVLQAVVMDLGLDRVWAERVFKRDDPLEADDAQRYLASNLQLKFKHGSDLVLVSATSDDPNEAANIANSVVNSYKSVRLLQPGGVPTKVGSPSPVQMVSTAQVPSEPSSPNKRLCYAITAALAGLLSVMIASAVEVCMLIARAEETARELEPAH